jgi:hypothetical protein
MWEKSYIKKAAILLLKKIKLVTFSMLLKVKVFDVFMNTCDVKDSVYVQMFCHKWNTGKLLWKSFFFSAAWTKAAIKLLTNFMWFER